MLKINFNHIDTLSNQSSESYKALRTNVLFFEEGVKVISFTSCQPNEGKSSVVFQLSENMAEANKKVLLIDADIRKSVMARRLELDRKVAGLSEYLSGQCELLDCLCATNVKNLDVILPGHVAPNPSELLSSLKFRNLLKGLRDSYDYIFIDCPPLGSVIDAAVVSGAADGAILVVESEVISRKFATEVKKQLERTGCHILGVVLNKVNVNKSGYYGGYYGKYYGKYGNENAASGR